MRRHDEYLAAGVEQLAVAVHPIGLRQSCRDTGEILSTRPAIYFLNRYEAPVLFLRRCNESPFRPAACCLDVAVGLRSAASLWNSHKASFPSHIGPHSGRQR